MWILNHGAVYPKPRAGSQSVGIWNYSSPLIDLLGVNWLLARREEPPPPRWRLAFRGDDGLDLWRNDAILPRAFVTRRAREVANEAEAARAIADPAFRPGDYAVVEEPTGVAPPADGVAPPPPLAFYALLRRTALDIAVEVETDQPGVLVLAEPWYPGWRATVDGQPAPILRADYALRGVALAAGRHTVAMVYEDLPLARGGAVSLAAFAVIIALALLARRRRAKSR